MTARPQKNSFKYRSDGKVITDFFWDRSPVSVIQGPVGSGTSTACCHKMWKISLEQEPDANGKRRSRWLVVRNTYNDLKETTIKTWKYWFEEKALGTFGELKMTNPPNHHIKWDAPDGTVVDAEFIFLALDQEEDVRKLLSLECTGVWFNEAQFTEKAVFDTAHARAMQGRYPPKLDGGPTWKGVICDLNAPPEGHWIPYMRGDIPLPDEWDDDQRREFLKPDDWAFFVQPPGLLEVIEDKKVVGYEENSVENRMKRGLEHPELAAENMKWLTESYLALIKGKPKNWIDTFVMNRVGIYRVGRPVFESFRPEIHVAKSPIEYQPEWPLLVGVDFARNPAAIIGQLIRGGLYILDEFGMENVSAGTFAPLLKQRIMRKFPGLLDDKSFDLSKVRPDDQDKIKEMMASAEKANIRFFGDPSGGSKGQGTDWTPYIIFAAHGMAVHAAPGNNVLSLRLAAIENQLNKMVDGRPGFLVNSTCRVFKTGMGGGYHFAKLKGQARYHETPMKDRYSDYCDAGQYLALGAGLGHAALNPKGTGPKPKKREKKPYSMKRGRRRA